MLSGKTNDQFTIADIFREFADVDTVFVVRVKNNNNDELVMVMCDYWLHRDCTMLHCYR